ncbi:MAG: glycosyltransferase family 4 protein, partial [Proteobacteria bacterium]|nr:glycosyltransferase family 4 protein [Pseudomonadota bacterium]
FKEAPKAFDHYAGAKVYRVPMLARGRSSLSLLFNYLSFVLGACFLGPWRLQGQAFDIIFVFEPSPVTVGLPAVLIGRLKKAPVVFWALDLWPETLVAVGVVRSTRVLAAIGHLVRFIYTRCALVLGQSRGFLENIAKYCDDSSKIRYFPSWAEDVFSQDELKPAPEVPPAEGSFNVLFAGNVGEAQDFPAVLDAAESLKHNLAIRWLVVGNGRMMDWLRVEVSRRGLERCFLLLGRFPMERMPSFYAHADVLLVSLKCDPVFSLTIPGKIQSYLMAGLPLLGMLDGEGANIIRDAEAGLVCPAGDANGLAQSVRQLAAMPRLERLRLGSNGRDYAKKEFNREVLMDRLEGWFVELARVNLRHQGETQL